MCIRDSADTEYVVVVNKGSTEAAFKQGGSTVSAALNTAGNIPLAGNSQSDPVPVSAGLDYFDSATS